MKTAFKVGARLASFVYIDNTGIVVERLCIKEDLSAKVLLEVNRGSRILCVNTSYINWY